MLWVFFSRPIIKKFSLRDWSMNLRVPRRAKKIQDQFMDSGTMQGFAMIRAVLFVSEIVWSCISF